MGSLGRRAAGLLIALAAPLLLTGCLLAPGKFTSTLDIRADRSFTFTYAGEVIAPKPDTPGAEEDKAVDPAEERKRMQTLADALSKEYGFRSVSYAGDDRLAIDYSISGRLTHGFVFPFNPDAEVLVPFLMIELRGKDGVRVKAPGFAKDGQASISAPGFGPPAGGQTNDRIDGTFTLTTDATIVSQNQEEGATRTSDGRSQVAWRITPLTKDAPVAVLRVAPLP